MHEELSRDTFFEVANSQSSRGGERDEGKKGGGEKSFNNGDIPAAHFITNFAKPNTRYLHADS